MLFPRNIEEKLGFDRIRGRISSYCLTEIGKELAGRIRFQKDFDLIDQQISAVSQMVEARAKGAFPSLATPDVREQVKRFEIQGTFLTEEELHDVREVADSSLRIIQFLEKNAEEYPALNRLMDPSISEGLQYVVDEINGVLDINGTIKSNASRTLSDLDISISKTERTIQSKINQVYKKAKEKGWVGETEITIRDGRPVLPVLAEHKRKIPGMVHDESGGGKLYYIEPMEVLELSSQLVELQFDRRREINRILKKVTKNIQPERQTLQKAMHSLGVIDLVRAKSIYAEEIDAIKPELLRDPVINLVEARHPHLYLKLKGEGKKVIPLNLSISDEQRIIVISGPNAGGKSVCLKTVALLQYMLQSGLLVPADDGTEMGLFENIFIDIGDDQSIENDLSSYSSHLVAMKHFVSFSNARTLCMMDELGTGTDPQFGGPMAEAVLETIHGKSARAVITTHFSNIKHYADDHEGVVNGAMAYDVVNLEPLFEFKVGLPGSSFAYEVAKKIGLQKKVIELARSKTDYTQQKVDNLLAELEKEKKDIQLEKSRLNKDQELAEKLKKDYTELKSELDSKKKEILNQAKDKALSIIEGANKDVERTIKEIREEGAKKLNTQKIRRKLEEKKSTLKVKEKPVVKEDREIVVGDQVQLPGTENFGEVVEIRKGKATVMVGAMKTSFPVKLLTPVSKTQVKKGTRKSGAGGGRSLMDDHKHFKTEIDLRGMRAEEALKTLDRWIDEALVLGFTSLRVIHGKGDGILKDRIRMHLKGQPFIDRIEYESVQLGGEGVSLIHLK